VTNEAGIISPTTIEVDTQFEAVRTLSGADLALYALLAGQVDLSGDVSLSLEENHHQPVPQELLAALLTSAARRLAGVADLTPLASVSLRYIEQAYTDEPLRFTRFVDDRATASDSTNPITVRVESADARPLAEAVVHFLAR
jgi:hypothetical protein